MRKNGMDDKNETVKEKITMDNKEKALLCHKEWNGKLETVAKSKVKTREDLAIAYTPGVAEPCKVIAEDKTAAYTYTWKANTVAVVSDGSAVLGLGNIGPYAAMPVMEGKCVLFKEFGNVNAVPILSGHPGHRRDHSGCEKYSSRIRRYQSGRHLRSALFRNRGTSERNA